MSIKNTPLFSVLIANYNNGQYLEECLQSVFNQSYTNWEVILVDDASTDKISHKIYKKYKDNTKVKTFYNKENKGCGYTKRRCVEEANGEICGFLDPDDTITHDALQIMVDAQIKHAKISLVYSTNYLCNPDLSINNINQNVGPIRKDESYFTTKEFVVSAFASFKKERYNQTSGINPNLSRAVDQDLYYKLDETGSFLFINKPLYFYRRHDNGISTSKNALKAKYWHALVATQTYKRRNSNNYRPNQTWSEIKKYWEDYYFWKAEEKALRGEVCKTIYLSLNAIRYGQANCLKKIKLIPYSIKSKLIR